MVAKPRMKFRAEVDRRKAADADRDAVAHAVAGAAFKRVTETVPKIEQQPFVPVELVDLDEPFLRAQAELDHPLDVSVPERKIFVETFITASEADLRRFAPSCGNMLGRQGLDRGHWNDDLIRRIEGPDQVLEVADIDR